MREFDYIIVGAGSAGCVLANKLSRDPDTTVLLLEAGKSDSWPLLRVPGYMAKLMLSEYSWTYSTVPQKHLNGRVLTLPQGKVLGGSSSINAMVYSRGNPEDYRHWRQLGNPGWDWEDVLPYYVGLEANSAQQGDLHGKSGPVRISNLPSPNPLSKVFVEAAVEIGVPRNPDYNGARQDGTGIFQFTCHRGLRWSAATAFLRSASRRRNLRVLPNTQVTRVLLENNRATGIEIVSTGGSTSRIRAAREVIVSSGAIGSPRLLLLSGIGPADELRAAGVEVTHDLPGVGKNFHDHVDIGSVFHCTQPITLDHQDRLLPSLRHGLELLLTGKGAAAGPGVEGYAYVYSDPSVRHPDISLHFLPIYVLEMARVRPPGHGMTLHNNLLRPKSRGEIKLQSSRLSDPPLIDPNYLSHPDDMKVMIECVKWARRIMATKAFAPYFGGELLPGSAVRTDAEIEQFVRAKAETDYHSVGTCKMGSDGMAVVDQQLRVHGIDCLRVIDSSVMPTVPSGNTQAPTMMIAAKASDMILSADPRPTDPNRNVKAAPDVFFPI